MIQVAVTAWTIDFWDDRTLVIFTAPGIIMITMTWGDYEGMQHFGVSVLVPSTAPPGTSTLTVTTSGSGTGTVTLSPPGIVCGSDCSEVFDYGTL